MDGKNKDKLFSFVIIMKHGGEFIALFMGVICKPGKFERNLNYASELTCRQGRREELWAEAFSIDWQDGKEDEGKGTGGPCLNANGYMNKPDVPNQEKWRAAPAVTRAFTSWTCHWDDTSRDDGWNVT